MKTVFPIERFQHIRTPFYYYDEELLSATLDEIRKQVSDAPNYHVHYAIKANANPVILRQISAAGLGADCVSGGEVERAVACGFNPSNIVFAGVGKSDDEISLALRIGISRFNVESIEELETIQQIAAGMHRTAHVAFRLNPNIDAHTHEKITTGKAENKFGIPATQVAQLLQAAQNMQHIQFEGLHFHLGSQITDLNVFKRLCQYINTLQDRLEQEGFALPTLNVGGGLGISYEAPDEQPIPDFKGYFDVFKTCLHLRPHQELHFELGRSVVAQCGSLISRVLYVKKGDTRDFLILDAGFTELIRPAMYGALHKIENLSSSGVQSCEEYDVVGPICESSDVFATHYRLPLSHRGDFVALRSAGAYGEAMASTYNCRPLVRSYYSTVEE